MSLRQPTPRDVLYAWHSRALQAAALGERRMIRDDPQPGWFKCRLVKGGPMVPARIWVYQWTGEDGELLDDEILQCEVDGRYANPVDKWSYLCGRPISEQEFQYMEALRQHCLDFEPDEPPARPRQKMDLLKVRIPFK